MESLVSGGMPIPRGRGGSDLPDLSTISLDLHEHSPFKSGLQGNSLGPQWGVGNPPLLQDNIGLSPLTPNSPSLWPAQNMDMDMDIKLEPLDDLLGVDDLIQGPTLAELNASDENLLDNVNFDDLLNPESAGIHSNSATTSLDHQHHSPAAMATVRPDEVMGIRRRHENSSSSLFSEIVGNESSNSSTGTGVLQQPIKEESPSLYSLLASSFPPQGGGWRDPLLTSSSLPGPSFAGRLASIEERPNSSTPQHIPFHQNQQHQQHQQQQLQQNNTGSTSALEELLLRSSSTPVSTTPLSPHSVASPHEATSPLDTSSQLDTSNMDNSPSTPLGISVPRPSSLSSANPLLSARLSSSAPVHNFSLEQAWQRREPRQHLLSTGSLAEEFGGSASSLSTVGGILSPGAHDLSIDEGIDSDDDSDNEHYDSDSDNDSNISEETSSLSSSYGKKERYFWQYNVQAKGPKGQKVAITHKEKDPHRLTEIMDPVFSPMCSLQGVKHSGKARRGDGNDLTPNPKKLVSIGRELDKLNKVINDMTPVSELPFNIRPKSRKEKNKLASRACRLKKKAQHEANKIKLYGLEAEHAKLMNLIADVKQLLMSKVETQVSPLQQQELTNHIEKSCKQKSKFRIAGHTTEFVNKVIDSSRNSKMANSLDEILINFGSSNRLSSSPVSNMNINNNSNMSEDVQMM